MKTYNTHLSLIYKHLIIGFLYCLCTPIQAQVGMIWGRQDVGSVTSMSTVNKVEVTYDISSEGEYVYALVGQADYTQTQTQSLFIYKYTAEGVLCWSRALGSSTGNIFTFNLENATLPSPLHIRAYNGRIYIAGTLTRGGSGTQPFPNSAGTVFPSGVSPFVAYADTAQLALGGSAQTLSVGGYTYIKANAASPSIGDAYIADIEINPTNGNVYVLGKAMEPAPYYCSKCFGGGGFGVYDPFTPAFVVRGGNSSTPTRGTKTSNNFAIDVFTASGTSVTLYNSDPCGTTVTNQQGEISFIAAYTADLSAFTVYPQGAYPHYSYGDSRARRGAWTPRALDLDGNFVYAAGTFSAHPLSCSTSPTAPAAGTTAPFAFRPDTTMGVTATEVAYSSDAFIVKWNTTLGTPVYSKKIGGSGYQEIQDINVKDNKILVALLNINDNVFNMPKNKLHLRPIGTLDDAQGIYILQVLNGGSSDTAIIERYQRLITNSGAILGEISIGTNNLQVDEQGNIYLTAKFSGALNGLSEPYNYTYSTNPVIQTSLVSSSGLTDQLVVKYASNMNLVWAKTITGSLDQYNQRIALADVPNSFYLSGGYYSTIDLEPAPSIAFNMVSRGSLDAYLAKYGCYTTDITRDTTKALCGGTPVALTIENNCPYGPSCSFIYSWFDPTNNTTFPSSGNQYVFNPTVGTNLRLMSATETNTGCVSNDTIDFIANLPVSVNVSPSSAQICNGSSIIFSATSNLPNAKYKWTYNSTPTVLDTTNALTALNAGSYSVEANVNGCVASQSVVLNQFNTQNPSILPDTATICGGTTRLEVVGCPGCNYTWNVPIGSSNTSSSSQIVADIQGTYSTNIVDANGCSYFKTKVVNNAPYLTPSIRARNNGGDILNTICNGQPLIVETLPFCPTCSYEWSDGSTANFTFAFTPSNFRVTVVDNASTCRGVSNSLVIQASSLTTPSIQADPTKVCQDANSITAAQLYVTPSCPSCYYKWYDNSNLNAILGLGTSIEISQTGNYVVEAVDGFECSEYSNIIAVATQTVSSPIVSVNYDRLCGMNTATLATTPCSGCTYQWYELDLLGQQLVTIAGANQATYRTNVPNTYYVEVRYANSCVRMSDAKTLSSDNFTIQINGQKKYICNGAPTTLSVRGGFELPPIWKYQWFRNGVAIPTGTGYTYNATQAGFYHLQIIDQDSCIAISQPDTVLAVSEGANPVIIADPVTLCPGAYATLTASSNTCQSCTYGWRLDDNTLLASTTVNSFSLQLAPPRGFYVSVRDSSSGCVYNSSIVQIRDTFLQAPVLSALSNPTCNPAGVGVILSTQSQPNTVYEWYNDNVFIISTTQSSYVATITNGSGKYSVLIRQGDCISNKSNEIPVSFRAFTASITSTNPTICNGTNVTITVAPSLSLITPTCASCCATCVYEWFNGAQSIPNSNITNPHEYIATGQGNYYAVVKDTANGNCADTTFAISVSSVSVAANINSSTSINGDTTYVCGPTSTTTLTVGSCAGCTYAWYKGTTSNPISGAVNTSYIVSGTAAADRYFININNNGCVQSDNISVTATPSIFTDSIKASPSNLYLDTLRLAYSCEGVPVNLLEIPPLTRSASRQWYKDGVAISGILGQQESYAASVAGSYYVMSLDSFGCPAKTNSISVVVASPSPGYALDFSLVNPMPITAAAVDLDNYLFPISKRPANGRGLYTSLTASTAINATTHFFTPSAAGAGLHLITYYDSVGACVFPTTDTIEVLQQLSVSMSNKRVPTAPIYETCIRDSIHIELSNFAFAPNAIQFYTDTGYRTISVTPTLTSYGSVYNGYVPVFIPQGARTGRVRLTDGTNNYQTPFFVVVHNPAVSMNLVGVTQPLCSTTPTVTLTGTPATSGPTGFGVFTAAYAASPNSPSTSLLATGTNVLNVNNITGYDFSGRQDLVLKYSFIPTYSDVAQTRCLDSVVAVLNAEARDVSLVSVQYTPISISQGAEPMENLSRLVFPVNSRLYTGTYTGTYVNAGSIVPNTITNFLPAATTDTVRYTINNGGCTNSTTVSLVSILPTPTITSVPSYICRIPNDTIFIGRNASGMYTRRGAVTSAPYNTDYLYQENIINQPVYSYIEKMHMMTLTSSNGGLSLINNTPGQELYAFIPSSIPGTVTNLNIQFGYYRTTDYFDLAALVDPTDTSSYVIGQNTITINFEDLPIVEISPATDTVFCQQENIFYQFSGTPNALPTGVPNGRFYLKRPSNNTVDTLANNNNLFNPFTNPITSGTLASAFEVYQLKYEYIGFACRDSAFKNIKLVKPFIINYATTSGIEFCQEEPDAAVTFTSPNLLAGNSLDTANCVFSVGGVPAGNFFSPSLRGTGTFATTFLAKDIFGCTAESAATFTVHSTPTLAMTFAPTLTIPAAICANNVPLDMAIFKNGRNITNNLLSATTFTIQSVRNAVINGATNQTTNLAGTPNYLGFRATSTPSNSPTLYNRRDTTVLDTIIYALRDSNGCFNRITQPITVYQLPALGLTELGGAPVQPTYCEGTSVRFVGAPLGGAFIGSGAITTTDPSSSATPPAVTVTALSAPSLNAATGFFTPSITPASVISVTETFAYTYQDVNTGCRDTIIKSTISLNRAEVTITGIPSASATCASLNSSYPLGIISTGASVSSYSFTSTPSTAVVTGTFYPSRANAVADPVNVGFLLTYISNGCVNTATATHLVNPLPILRFTPPGDTLANGAGKGYHICRSGVQQLLIAQNKFGSINPYTTINPQNDPAFPNEFRGRGVVYDATSGYYVYNPAIGNAGYDTLVYTYTDPRGCRDSVKNTVFVDTVPTLGFAGFNPSHLLGDTIRPDTFMYCANEPAFLVVPSPFGGFLSFQNQLQSSGVYNVLPDNLDTNPATTYEMKYVFISARYQNGGVCQDSAKVYLQVRPTPVLNFVNLPPQICAADSSDTLHLHATPVGGTFQDYTIGAVAGIINGNIFNANAQYGNRDLRYFYTDPVSTCSDTVYQQIKVYRIPEAGFTSAGGCQNDAIVLAPTPNSLSSTLPGRDSITMYVWDYGNGITDTIRPTGTSVVVPNRNYTYPDAGIYFPQLTIVNRNVCVDTFVLRIPVSSKVTVTPANAYVQDFESGSDWMQATDTIAIPTDSVWGMGIATGARITTQQENNHVWKTHLDSIYQPGERGVVYSPCFDISALRRPMFAMDMVTDTREGIDGAVLEYLHPTRGWVALGSRYKGINWYDSLYLVSAPGAQIDNPIVAPIGWSGDTEWVDGFKTARFRLDTDIRNGDLRGMTSVRFRMAFAASPNTVVASREGVAFDNIYIGERGRSVLVEHFTNIYTPGINVLQDTLYRRLFNPLYGRDVVLLQYHSNNDPSITSLDGYFDNSSTISQSRSYYYGVFALPRVRINGQNYVASTTDFVNPYTNYLEYLDMEMLEDKTFDIRIPTTPQIFQAAASATVGSVNSSVVITAAKDLPQAKYVAHAVITEDSLGGIPNTHKMMSVVRTMLPNAAGTPYEFAWAAGEAQTLTLSSTFPVKLSNTSSFNTYKPSNLRLVVFVQDDSSKLVHQVATSRNLTIYNGAVAVEELPMEEGKEIMEFKLFPNPAQDQFNIAFDQALQGEYQWRLVDMLGQTLREGRAQAGTEQLSIPTNEYASGMYIFTINNDKVYSQRQVIIARP